MQSVEPIYVVGAGGIGCAVGYALITSGTKVCFVEADTNKVAWGRQHGVRIDARPGLPADFIHFREWQPASPATVLLCTKCYDNAEVLARLPPEVNLIPVQNGFDPALETNGHSAEGIASFVSECRPQQTSTRITRQGRLHIGARGSSNQNGTSTIANCLRGNPIFVVEPVPDILPYKYTKLMYNAAISPLAAAAGLDNGQLLSVPKARRLFFTLLRENYAILHGAGVQLAKIGPFHPDTVQVILRHCLIARSMAWAFYPTLRGSYCSMAGDLPRGRTEIDNYNGHLIALAGERPCPLNRQVYQIVQRMAAERISPHREILDELLPLV
jgi:2-dehydropantoate 2-reductase